MTDIPESVEGWSKSKPVLFVLYGDLNFDGRAQRLLTLLNKGRSVKVVAVYPPILNASAPRLIKRARQAFAYLQLTIRALRAAVAARPSHVVAANYFTVMPAAIVSLVSRALLLYDAYEYLIPDVGDKASWRDRVWYWVERIAIRRARLVIAANPERLAKMAAWYKLKCDAIHVRNVPAPPRVEEEAKKMVRTQFRALERASDDECLLIYQGNIAWDRGIHRFIAMLNYLPCVFRLIIVGDGPDIKKMKDYCALRGLESRVDFLGRVSNGMLPAVTACADIGLVSYSWRGTNNLLCSPNKVFEYAQAGIPILASNQPTLRALLANCRVSRCFSASDSDQVMADHVRRIADNKGDALKEAQEIAETYTTEREEARLLEAFTRIGVFR